MSITCGSHRPVSQSNCRMQACSVPSGSRRTLPGVGGAGALPGLSMPDSLRERSLRNDLTSHNCTGLACVVHGSLLSKIGFQAASLRAPALLGQILQMNRQARLQSRFHGIEATLCSNGYGGYGAHLICCISLVMRLLSGTAVGRAPARLGIHSDVYTPLKTLKIPHKISKISTTR